MRKLAKLTIAPSVAYQNHYNLNLFNLPHEPHFPPISNHVPEFFPDISPRKILGKNLRVKNPKYLRSACNIKNSKNLDSSKFVGFETDDQISKFIEARTPEDLESAHNLVISKGLSNQDLFKIYCVTLKKLMATGRTHDANWIHQLFNREVNTLLPNSKSENPVSSTLLKIKSGNLSGNKKKVSALDIFKSEFKIHKKLNRRDFKIIIRKINLLPDIELANYYINELSGSCSISDIIYDIAEWNVLGNPKIQVSLLNNFIINNSAGNDYESSKIFPFINLLKRNNILITIELINQISTHFSKSGKYKLAYTFMMHYLQGASDSIFNHNIDMILEAVGRDKKSFKSDQMITKGLWDVMNRKNRSISSKLLVSLMIACSRTSDTSTLSAIQTEILAESSKKYPDKLFLKLIQSYGSSNLFDTTRAIQAWNASPLCTKKSHESISLLLKSIENRAQFLNHLPELCSVLVKFNEVSDGRVEEVKTILKLELERIGFQLHEFEDIWEVFRDACKLQ